MIQGRTRHHRSKLTRIFRWVPIVHIYLQRKWHPEGYESLQIRLIFCYN